MLLAVKGIRAFVERLLALQYALLHGRNLALALLFLGIRLLSELENLLTGLHQGGLLGRLGIALGVSRDALCLLLGVGEPLVGLLYLGGRGTGNGEIGNARSDH